MMTAGQVSGSISLIHWKKGLGMSSLDIRFMQNLWPLIVEYVTFLRSVRNRSVVDFPHRLWPTTANSFPFFMAACSPGGRFGLMRTVGGSGLCVGSTLNGTTVAL